MTNEATVTENSTIPFASLLQASINYTDQEVADHLKEVERYGRTRASFYRHRLSKEMQAKLLELGYKLEASEIQKDVLYVGW